MIPNFNIQEFLAAGKRKAEEYEQQDKQKKTSCSQQALANQMVGQSMPRNPNVAPIQQQPANAPQQ